MDGKEAIKRLESTEFFTRLAAKSGTDLIIPKDGIKTFAEALRLAIDALKEKEAKTDA